MIRGGELERGEGVWIRDILPGKPESHDAIDGDRAQYSRYQPWPGGAVAVTGYEAGFRNFKMGYASAASWILFLIVGVATVLYFRTQDRWVHYQ